MEKPLAVILARQGSQRFPGKHLARLQGKPLVVWALESVTMSALFRDVIVSSDAPEIKRWADSYKAIWHERPAALATHEATVDDVLRHLPVEPGEIFYVLLPTSPLRTVTSVRNAWAYFEEGQPDADGLLSLTHTSPHPLWALSWDGHRVTPQFPYTVDVPRPLLTPLFAHDGGHYIVKRSALEIQVGRRQMLGWLSPSEESVDIDTPQDLRFAEFLCGSRQARD